MTESLKKRRGTFVYQCNPFMTQIQVRSKRVTNKRGNMSLVDNDTGAIATSIAGFWETEEVDSAKFVKLFINGVKALKELTSAGTKVFEVLYLGVQNNIEKERIYMSFSSVDQDVTPMSESTYMRGMKELINKEFLAATPHVGMYWLNPDFIWNGDRLAFVKQYYKNDKQ